jgi:hypothetical protein
VGVGLDAKSDGPDYAVTIASRPAQHMGTEGQTRRGVVVVGDSISYAEGHRLLGVTMRSWAQWLAMALELPYTCLAVPGATAPEVVRAQVPRLRGPYDIGCVLVGTNDVDDPAFDPAHYERELVAACQAVGRQSDVLLLATLRSAAGVPPYGRRALEANDVVRRTAQATGAILCDAADVDGWLLVHPDAVHLTAIGQLELADRAAQALAAAGVPVARMPSQLVERRDGRLARMRHALTRHGPLRLLYSPPARWLLGRARPGEQAQPHHGPPGASS